MTGGAEDVPPDVYDRAMAVLVKASYLAAKFGVPHLREAGGGSIVNISSIHGLLVARRPVYGQSCPRLRNRQSRPPRHRRHPPDGDNPSVRLLHRPIRPRRPIRVNAIAPGHIVRRRSPLHPAALGVRPAQSLGRQPLPPPQAVSIPLLGDVQTGQIQAFGTCPIPRRPLRSGGPRPSRRGPWGWNHSRPPSPPPSPWQLGRMFD